MPIIGGLIGSSTGRGKSSQGGGATSGISIEFSPTLGTSFTLQHDLESTNLLWTMFITSVSPAQSVIPDSVEILDNNRIRVGLQTPMEGIINLVPV